MTIPYKDKSPRSVNYLKTMYFDDPDWIPCRVGIMPATWIRHGEDLDELVLSYPALFPGFEKGEHFGEGNMPSPLYEAGRSTDCWGTVWDNIEPGLDSQPVEFPLSDWSDFDEYEPPSPLGDDMFGPRDWKAARQQLKGMRDVGDIACGHGLPHGFLFMRLWYLRGFDNFMMDIATGDSRLDELTEIVENYNCTVINKYLDMGAEMMGFGEDLGLQDALPMSPTNWREHIKPSYDRMFAPCREKDIPVRLHTDGHILEIIPDLIEVGVTLLNPQFRSNGLDGLKEVARGKVALDQDLDRQLFPFASPSTIEDHIGEVVEELNTPEGGLMLYAECEPDLSLKTIDAICTSLEKICQPPHPDELG